MRKSKYRWTKRVWFIICLRTIKGLPLTERLANEVIYGKGPHGDRLWYFKAQAAGIDWAVSYALRHPEQFPGFVARVRAS